MVDLQQYVNFTTDQETLTKSIAEWFTDQADTMTAVYDEIQQALTDETYRSTSSQNLLGLTQQGTTVKFSRSDIINAIAQGAESLQITVNDHFEYVMIDDYIESFADSLSAWYIVAEAADVIANRSVETVEAAQHFINRINLKFNNLSDTAAQYGYILYNAIMNQGMTAYEKLEYMLTLIGFGKDTDTSIGIPTCDLTETTGVNMYTAFITRFTYTVESAIEMVTEVCQYVIGKIGSLLDQVTNKAFSKVKQIALAATTLGDSFYMSNQDSEFNGFTDYGGTAKYDGDNIYSKFYAYDKYSVCDIGPAKIYMWLVKNADNTNTSYHKSFFKLIPYEAWNYKVPVTTHPSGGGTVMMSFADLVVQQASGLLESHQVLQVWNGVNAQSFRTPTTDSYMAAAVSASQLMSTYILAALMYYSEEETYLTDDQLLKAAHLLGLQSVSIWNPSTDVDNISLARLLMRSQTGEPTSIDSDIWNLWLEWVGWGSYSGSYQFFPYYHTNAVTPGKFSVYTDQQLADLVPQAVITVAITAASIIAINRFMKTRLAARMSATKLYHQATDSSINSTLTTDEAQALFRKLRNSNRLAILARGAIGGIKDFVGNALNNFSSVFSLDGSNTRRNASSELDPEIIQKLDEIKHLIIPVQ